MPVDPIKEQKQDRQIVERLVRRDPSAMMDLYERYGRLLYSIIFRAVNDRAAAEDITQETFLRIWSRVGSFDAEKGNLEGWLVTVARNRAIDYLRAVRKAPEVASISFTELEGSHLISAESGHADRFAAAEALKSAMSGLNSEQREVIELTHFEGLTQSEIAGRLQKPIGTVKGLVRSALKSLRSTLAACSSEVRHEL